MSSTDRQPGTASPDAAALQTTDAELEDALGADDSNELSPEQEAEFARVRDAATEEQDAELDDMQREDALTGGLQDLMKLVDSTPPYRADADLFYIKLRLYPELTHSPIIDGYLTRPTVAQEESRETLLAITVKDKGRTKDGGQRQQLSLDDTPANSRMFLNICEKVHCALRRGEEPRDYTMQEPLTGTDPKTRQTVTKPVWQWIPGYIKDDFIYHLLDSRFRLVDAQGNIIDESAPQEQYFALLDLRQFYILQEIGSVQRKDATWTPPRHRALYTINEPHDGQRTRFKQSGFYYEQTVKDRQRSEQRAVKLRIMMALFNEMADNVYGMVVGTGRGEETRALDVRNEQDRQFIFGTWQKNALLPVFNNLMGIGGK